MRGDDLGGRDVLVTVDEVAPVTRGTHTDEHVVHTWEDYAVVELTGEPDDAERAACEYELPDNGWGGLIAWVAGPQRVFRRPSQRDYTSLLTCMDASGVVVFEEMVPLSADEIASISDDRDQYLSEAGIPPMPRGFDWFLDLTGTGWTPAAFGGQLTNDVYDLLPGKRPTTGETRDAMAVALENLLGTDR
jgi:hypothetical protein